jgi:hypothetical protein
MSLLFAIIQPFPFLTKKKKKKEFIFSAQNSHFCGVWERQLVGSFNPQFFGEAGSHTQTRNLLLLVEGTCHRTRPASFPLQTFIYFFRCLEFYYLFIYFWVGEGGRGG